MSLILEYSEKIAPVKVNFTLYCKWSMMKKSFVLSKMKEWTLKAQEFMGQSKCKLEIEPFLSPFLDLFITEYQFDSHISMSNDMIVVIAFQQNL